MVLTVMAGQGVGLAEQDHATVVSSEARSGKTVSEAVAIDDDNLATETPSRSTF
jgi:hypothetical protein